MKQTKSLLADLKDSDYNGGKSGGTWVLAYSFATDDRKAAEQDLIRLARSAWGCSIAGTRGTFVYERRVESDFTQLPARIKYENLRRWVAQARLFEAPMFIYDPSPGECAGQRRLATRAASLTIQRRKATAMASIQYSRKRHAADE